MLCKFAYKKKSDRTKKLMIFCRKMGDGSSMAHICISQRFCPNKDQYIETNPKKECKYYEE